MEDKPVVDQEIQLEKFPGKGGWTYARIPEVAQNPSNPFGWVTVRAIIDGIELNPYKLMPMGNSQLFLPVKAAIRKKIKKQAGDFVRVKIYLTMKPLDIPEELKDCLQQEDPAIYLKFLNWDENLRKQYLDWIYEAQKPETRAERIVKLIEALIAA